jgi:hypothetical protein
MTLNTGAHELAAANVAPPDMLPDDELDAVNGGTAPLQGLGRIGPPFLHDGRVYLP